MNFKIVQTIEGGKCLLSICPYGWEVNNKLFWPKHHASKLQKDSNSRPTADWNQYNCVKKRTFDTFEEAIVELNTMMEREDSDIPASTKRVSASEKKVKLQRMHIGRPPPVSFNNMANEILERDTKKKTHAITGNEKCLSLERSKENLVKQKQKTIIQSVKAQHSSGQKLPIPSRRSSSEEHNMYQISDTDVYPNQLEQSEELTVEKVTNYLDQQNIHTSILHNSHESQILVTDDGNNFREPTLGDIFQLLHNNQQTLQDLSEKVCSLEANQGVIIEELASQKVMLEEYCSRKISTTTEVSTTSKPKEVRTNFDTIGSIENLTNFEKKLSDDKFFSETVEILQNVCGVSGKIKGGDCAYTLIDIFFTRDFLTLCSWGGGSRGTDECKIAFKSFPNVFKLFLHLIILADKDYTSMKCVEFFKIILKNSKRRQLSGPFQKSRSRISTTKSRPKVSSCNKKIQQHHISDNELENACGTIINPEKIINENEFRDPIKVVQNGKATESDA